MPTQARKRGDVVRTVTRKLPDGTVLRIRVYNSKQRKPKGGK